MQFKRRPKTVHLITKQAKLLFKNEQSSIDEFEVRCLETEHTERESGIYIIANS